MSGRREQPKESGAEAPYGAPRADLERAAADLVVAGRLVAETPWDRYRRLDQDHRRSFWSSPAWFPEWHLLRPDDVGRLAQRSGRPLVAGGLLSMHHSGFVREAAVRVLTGAGDPEALPFLMVRSGDWVAEVRAVAQAGIRALMEPANGAVFLRAAGLVRPMATERTRESGFADEVWRWTVATVDRSMLLDALVSGPPRPRRVAAHMLIARGDAVVALGARPGAGRRRDRGR